MRMPHFPPAFDKLLTSLPSPARLFEIQQRVSSATIDGRYLHWDELCHRPAPDGLSHEDWWLGLKINRLAGGRTIPLRDVNGRSFRFSVPDLVTDLLHQIDRGGGTFVDLPEQVTNADQRDRYIVRSLVEEAITSSQLEGAVTTRDVAKKMLMEGRMPRDRGERMIANNYATMNCLSTLKDQELTRDLVLEIHRGISEGALVVSDGAGRLRRPDENISVSDMDGTVFHKPPPAEELPGRLDAMCAFANKETPSSFVHPVVRGIVLHFWLAYDHPFVDGNGRTARALFYWQMLREKYWMFEFISISQFLRKAPAQYATAFLHTETDDNDLTYFLIHQAEVIRRALNELHDYVARKSSETRASFYALQKFSTLNHRQHALIAHALRHPGFTYNIAGHGARHAVVYQTARTDLLALVQMGLLEQGKAGRSLVFVVPRDLEFRLQSSDD